MNERMTDRRVVLVTDSSASLPRGVLEREGIETVPISFVFDGEVYRDGTLSPAEFYELLESASGRPMTTSPEPAEFVEAFRRAADAGATDVLCLTMSAKLSGTYRIAQTAAELAADDVPGIEVHVVDTGGLAMTHGFAVLAAAEALRSGATVEEAAAAAQEVGSQAELVGVLDSMKYLAKGGRVPWIVHWAAAALRIKPVLAWGSGDVRAVARPRTLSKALDRVIEYARERLDDLPSRVAVMHASAPEVAERLAERVREELPESDVIVTEFTSAMGVHTGPGFAGLAFYLR